MNELINVQTTEQGEQRVSARELHKALNIKERFSVWFGRYNETFIKDEDFTSVGLPTVVNNGATRVLEDYSMTLDMAKHIAMMTKTDKGRVVRNYFIQVEKAFNSPEMMMARSLEYANTKLLGYEAVIEEMKPKAIFADAVAASHTSILVGELAKLINQNGVKIGQNRLFAWLRENGYLIQNGSSRNLPTQRSMEAGWFEIKETSIAHSDGHTTINKTPKVTGKGQQYFINKFLNNDDIA